MNKKTWWYIGLISIVLLFLGNNNLYITDTVESNYALTAKEMVMSGDWLSPQIFGNYWYDKPVFFYWLTAISFKWWGYTEFGARFFPSIFGLLCLLFLAWSSWKLYNEKIAIYSTLILVSTVEFFLISKSVITDSILFLFLSMTLVFFYLGYRDRKSSYFYGMYISSALGVLTKGPIGIVLPGLIIFFFLLVQKRWSTIRQMKVFTGLLLFCILTIPWYAYMYEKHGLIFLETFFGTHNILRATVAEHPRDNVWYYYLMVNILALFPWSAVFLLPVRNWWKTKKVHLDETETFLIIWGVVVFAFFQCMATKYITYTYPLLFPCSILLANVIQDNPEVLTNKWFGIGWLVPIYGILGAASYWIMETELEVHQFIIIMFAIGVSIFLWFFKRKENGLIALNLGAILVYIALIITVAIPLSLDKSGYEIVMALNKISPNLNKVGVIGSFPTSAKFYDNNREYIKIVDYSKEDYNEKRGFTWNDKNVEPITTWTDPSYSILIVHKKEWENFIHTQKSVNWKVMGCLKEWIILEKAK